jgi:FdhD protein
MSSIGTVGFDIHRVNNYQLNSDSDTIAIEEPLEIVLKHYSNGAWIEEPLMVTMRTPGDDYSLISGLLFSEGVISNINDIEKISPFGSNKGKYNIENSMIVTLAKDNKVSLNNLQRHFMVNSSCGVCGKGTLNAIEIAFEPNIIKNEPLVNIDLITRLPELFNTEQAQFAETGGVHASGLFGANGDLLYLSEDVGRHNALDKLIGNAKIKNILNPVEQFVMCSGRIGFDIIQKILMSGIGMVVGIGAPTSLAIDLAKKFNITLIGFIKKQKYNIYNGEWRIKPLS